MFELPQTRSITIKSYIDDINKSIDTRNYLSALSLSLIIPDICSKYLNWNEKHGKGYIKWFNKYVKDESIPITKEMKIKYKGKIPETYTLEFDGKWCYSLRCSILHEGITPVESKYIAEENINKIKTIELSVNGKSDRDFQYGESSRVMKTCKSHQYTIRINIINFAKNIINGCEKFLNEYNIDDIELFTMIDWDNKGNIIFTPNDRT